MSAAEAPGAIGVSLVAGNPAHSVSLRTRNSPGNSDIDTWSAIRRALTALSLNHRDTVPTNSTSLDKSWENAVLFSYSDEKDLDTNKGNASIEAGIEITCTTCYIKGIASTRFVTEPDFNLSLAFDSFTREVKDEVDNLTTAAVDDIENFLDDVGTKLGDGLDLNDFEFPTLNFDFNVDLPEIPEFRLQFQFDGLELYMLVDTVLSAGATYTLNLYTSKTIIGFSVGDELEIGVIFSLDLILSVEGEIDISTGFHIKLEDGVVIDIAMFSKNVSRVVLNGGEFEFLPVTVESAGVVFKAILRVGAQVGFEIASPSVSVPGLELIKASAGVELSVFANIADFTTNVTLSSDEDNSHCKLQIVESYQLALGAAAGASIAIGENTWGPVPETEIPIFYTTLADACAIQGRGSPTSTATTATTSKTIKLRDEGDDGDNDMTTTTISTDVIFVAIACQSEGMVNCPVSLQKTSKSTTTKTLVTVVSSGSEATFPNSIQSTVASTIPFGDGAKKLFATSGTPGSYVPPPPTSSVESDGSGGSDNNGNIADGKTGGVPNRVIIGVSIGLGIPVLLGAIATTFFFLRRRHSSVQQPGRGESLQTSYLAQRPLESL